MPKHARESGLKKIRARAKNTLHIGQYAMLREELKPSLRKNFQPKKCKK